MKTEKYAGFSGSVSMGLMWEFPRVFLWAWDGYRDEIQSYDSPASSPSQWLKRVIDCCDR